MKLFTDNQADLATVSGTDGTVNYPASNVQVSTLDRIYRGGKQVDFDISGSGSLKNISQAYTNLVQDPADLRAAGSNWTASNTTDAISTLSINDNLFTQIINSGANTGYNYQDFTATFTNLILTGKVIIKKGSSAGNTTRFQIYNTTAATTIFDIVLDWDDNPSDPAIATGTLLKANWIDDETIEVYFKCVALAALTNDIQIRAYGSNNATTAEYTYWSEVQLIDDADITMFPFVAGTHAADVIDETFTMPDRFTFDMIVTPHFSYDDGVFHKLVLWFESAIQEFVLQWHGAQNKFYIQYQDGTNERYLFSQEFDDGSSFTNINQRIRIIGSMDLVSGGINDSRFIVIPLEAGALFEDSAWSGAPDIKATSFDPLYIGVNQSGSLQADSQYEYLRIYEGLLVGTVASSDDVDTLLEPKKLLLDKTYQQKLTATDLLIANSTINDGDTITLRANDVDSYNSGTPLDETVTWSKDITTHSFTKSTYQFWRISINSSNIIDMGRIYLGPSYDTAGISPAVTHALTDNSIKTTGSAGNTFGDERYKQENVGVSFPALTQDQKAEIFAIFKSIGHVTPFFVTFDETALDLNTMYVTINQGTLDAQLLINSDYYSLGISLKEEV